MDKTQAKNIRRLLISFVVLFMLPDDTLQHLYIQFFRTPFSMRKLEFLLRTSPQTLLVALASLICLLVMLVSLISIVAHAAGGRRESASRPASRPAARRPAPARAGKAFPQAMGRQEEAIHCEHERGKDKYLEQLDGYLKTGLIDRSEYRVLRERYERINIPDNYH